MNFWEKAEEKLQTGVRLILMIVIKSEGSSPGKPGFSMMVADDGEIWGSIGGGAMEYRLTEKCRRLFNEEVMAPFIQKQDHHPDSTEDNSGMICSGIQWIAFYPLYNSSLNLIKNIVTIQDNKTEKVVSFTEKGIKIIKPDSNIAYPISSVTNDSWEYSTQPGLKNRLYIFGAGHVSLALSKMAKDLDFQVEVFDNRKTINTFDDNKYADKKTVINYANAGNYVKEGNHIFVVIMTFAHKSDTIVLKQVIKKKLRYLGMMGSEMKVESVFGMLKQEGYEEKDITRVDAPIGLPINSITPAEIAVSIMAKIIQVMNS